MRTRTKDSVETYYATLYSLLMALATRLSDQSTIRQFLKSRWTTVR